MKQNKIPRNEYIRKPAGKTNPYKHDVLYTNLGQWKYPGQVTRIPSNDITMQGVPYPVYGEDDLGYGQMMYPGMDYTFPGQYVTEIPMAQKGEQVENRTLWGVGSQFIPVYETYLDWKNIASGIKTGNKSDKYAGIIGLAQPFSGKALSNTLDYATEKTLGKKTADYNQKKREDIVNMSQHDREKLFLKYGHGGYDAWAKDGFPELAYGGDPSLPNITGHYKTGGWLDEIEDEFRRGGGYATPPKLRRKAKKYGTSKNIQSSINKIFTKNKLFTRNYDVFGPSGKNIYNPNSKYEKGGVWLEEYQKKGEVKPYQSKNQEDYDYRKKMYNDSLQAYNISNKLLYNADKYFKGKSPEDAKQIILAQKKEAEELSKQINPNIKPQNALNVWLEYNKGPYRHSSGKSFYVKEPISEKYTIGQYSAPTQIVLPPKKDYTKSQWDFSGADRAVRYYDEGNKLLYSDILQKTNPLSVERFYESNYEGEKKPLNMPYAEWEKMLQNKEDGGELYDYQAGGSIVDYLSKKGIDSSKENRKKLAQQYGVKDYNFTAEKNIELLNKLVAGKPVAQKTVAPKPIPSYLQPIKPIEKPNAKSDRTGQKKNVKIASDADLYSEDAKWYNSLPKEEKEFIKRSTAAQYKEPDELKQYVPQGKISKAWDVITNPISALEEYHKHGRIPDNLSESPDRNAIDMAVDVINPAFYINAAGRTAKNLTSADTYSDIAKGLGAAAIGLTGEEAPDEWVEGGLNTLDRALDAVTAAQGLKLVKTIPRGYRDMKYNNQITVGKGADKKTFKNSADFLEAHKAKMKAAGKDIPLKKKEIAFLNKEIKQRGVLEASRRHPLDPRSAMAKAMVIPEDYNWKTVLNPKNIARNLYKTATEGSPESLYQMGHGRVAGWNTYLGIPTKNNPYRIHPESFKQGEDLLYTLPEKQIEKVQRMNVKSGSPFASDQMSPKKGIKELEFFKNIPAKKTKAFNEKAYDKVASDMRKVLDDQGNRYYTNAEIKQTLGPKSKFKYTLKKHKKLAGDNIPDFMTREGDMYRTGDWDRYIGSHGGVGWKVIPDEATGKQRWIMEDVWDIQPLSRIKSKAVPQFVKDLDFGKVLGGKNYKVRLDYLKNLNSNRITPLVPKKMGGWLDNMD